MRDIFKKLSYSSFFCKIDKIDVYYAQNKK